MSAHFHPVKVKEVKKETEDCVSVAFEIPDELKKDFAYQPGQYVNVRAFIHGKEERRSFSLCSSPMNNEWRIAIKKVPGGIFSAYAMDQLKAGDTIDLMPPMGKFTIPLDPSHYNNYVAIAAGSGITPVISIIKSVLAIEQNSSISLVYGNRNRQSIIFLEELEAMKNKYMDRFNLIHILSREITDATINTGRIDAQKCDLLFGRSIELNADAFLICGPSDMIFCIRDYLVSRGIDEKKIHFELFTTPGIEHAIIKQKPLVKLNELQSNVLIKIDGGSINFQLNFDGETVLDAALQQGANVPYSCKSGVCTTCRAKLIEGSVEMEVNYGLEPEEVEKGFILTCQSHPTSGKVVIDFDAK